MNGGGMVSPIRAALIAAIAAFGVMASEAALARGYPQRGGHVRFGLYVGAPAYWGGYWGPLLLPTLLLSADGRDGTRLAADVRRAGSGRCAAHRRRDTGITAPNPAPIIRT